MTKSMQILDLFKKIVLSAVLAGATLFTAAFLLSCMAYRIPKSDPWFIPLGVLSMLESFLIMWGIWMFMRRKDPEYYDDIYIEKPNNYKYIMLALGFVLLQVVLEVIIGLLLPQGNPAQSTGNNTTQMISHYSGPIMVLIGVIYPIFIGPLLEEIIFRGVIGSFFNVFKDKRIVNIVGYVVISGLIFGAMHFQTEGSLYDILASFTMPTVSGIIFAYEYYLTKNLTYSYLTHMLGNLLVIAIQNM